MSLDFTGTGVALITPFNKDLSIDFYSLKKLVERCIDSGVDYLVALGTTAEAPTLTKSEKLEVATAIVEAANKRVPVMLGIGGNNTASTMEDFDHFASVSYDGVLSVTPYYNKPSQAGLIKHFQIIADRSEVPVMLYNIPGRAGVQLSLETISELAKHDNIFGIKEATESVFNSFELVSKLGPDFKVVSGDDVITLPILSVGGEGVISVIANLLPSQFSSMVKACLANDFVKAREINLSFLELNKAIFAEGNPVGIKYAMSAMGLCQPYVRQPLEMPSEDLRQHIDGLVKDFEEVEA